jgi:hypothetical protein
MFIIVKLIRVMVMVFNATFNNISAISWQLVLLLEETGVPGENHQTGCKQVDEIESEYFMENKVILKFHLGMSSGF